ncbi:MAG: adaptor protein MecA [Clostridia bacterium]|jgi:adapter protein MecA 1/2|nr:adaptor protein MecA [Clostridium sp.]MEE0268313.1 adaptor protein MecA [Clostridia bacterium]
MRFEKLSNDKIRIILDLQDLEDNDIDYQSFMSNSSDSQKLFMEILDEAEEQIGFITKDYKLMIEALATIDGDFIITVTRSLPDFDIASVYKKRTIKAKRKSNKLTTDTIIYEFNNFDDIFDFVLLLKNLNISGLNAFTKDFALYTYKNNYYLVMDNIDKNFDAIKTFLCALTEFGKSINNSNLFKSRLNEYGTLLVKNNFYKALSKNLK